MAERETTGDEPVAEYVRDALLIYQEEDDTVAQLREAATERGVRLQEISARQFFDQHRDDAPGGDATAHWIAVGDDRVLRNVTDLAAQGGASLGMVCTARPSRIRSYFDLPYERVSQIDLALRRPDIALDVLRCNGELVLGQAAVGDIPFLDRRGQAIVHAQDTLWRRWAILLSLFWTAVRRLFVISPSAVKLHIGSEEKPRGTAVTGILLLENDVDHVAGRLLGEELSARDGRVSAVLVAPTSVIRYLGFLLRAALGVGGGKRLPGALSYVKTRQLRIESAEALDYRVDGVRHRDKRIDITVAPQSLALNLGARFRGMPGRADDGDKDTLKLANLPENEARLAMIRKRLPLFTHALEDDFKDLFLLLRDSARAGPDYVTLMILSSVIGALGLVLNSAAVIIGAMVLAPLMAPIISLSMAALRRDSGLLRASASAIGVGVALSIGTAAVVALMMPMRLVTPEIEARLAPSLLDLGVAVFSGVAGAYAYARESVMKSLPGVAIAVALVPPLAVVGIGLGWADASIFFGALLLFLTNLVGIALAGAITFMVLGFGPVKRVTSGLWAPLAATVVIAIPLYLSLDRIHTVWQIERSVADVELHIAGTSVQLERPRVSIDRGITTIRADLYAEEELDRDGYRALRDALASALEREVVLDLSLRKRLE